MPKTQIDYSKLVIYKIVPNDINLKFCYIGSTTDFRRRKYNHKSDCNNIDGKHYNLYVYEMIRNNGGWNNWVMIEIEKFPCLDGNESRTRERYHIELINPNLNIHNPINSKEETKEMKKQSNINHALNNRESINLKASIYRNEHRDEINEKQKLKARERYKVLKA